MRGVKRAVRARGAWAVRHAVLNRLACVALAAILVALVAAKSAVACGVCIEPPERTVVDHLIGARDIVLAREDPENPFRFRAVETLRGSADGAAIAHLVDSATRRRLAISPDLAVAFSRDAREAPWRRLIVATPRMREVLTRIVARGGSWMQPSGQGERFANAAALHADADPAVRALALAELDRTH